LSHASSALCAGAVHRQLHAEDRAAAHPALDPNRAAALRDDPLGDGQSQPRRNINLIFITWSQCLPTIAGHANQ